MRVPCKIWHPALRESLFQRQLGGGSPRAALSLPALRGRSSARPCFFMVEFLPSCCALANASPRRYGRRAHRASPVGAFLANSGSTPVVKRRRLSFYHRRVVRRDNFFVTPCSVSVTGGHHARRHSAASGAGGFRDEQYGTRAARRG